MEKSFLKFAAQLKDVLILWVITMPYLKPRMLKKSLIWLTAGIWAQR